jgi:hypothetical protein
MKECFKCKKLKPISEFYKHSQMADGHLNKCKLCTKLDAYNHRHNSKSREKVLAYDRARGNRQTSEYLKQYRKKFPNKYRAHNLVSRALSSKKLFRQPCEICGKENTEAHHDDYAKPLNVRWLCAEHHRKWHSENGSGLNA